MVFINHGPLTGKLATVVDIVDQNKCLIDGPYQLTGVKRQVISYTRIALTDYKVDISKSAPVDEIVAAWDAAEVLAKWEKSSWSKKLEARKKRANLSDFGRFKVMVAKKQKRKIINDKLKTMS